MDHTEQRVSWDEGTHAHFQEILKQIPDLIRGIAETRVSKKAENIVREKGRSLITQEDMVHAFFAETPPGFVGPMKNSMKEQGIDYAQYGYPQ